MKKVFSIWTEDIGSWATEGAAQVFKTREKAQQAMEEHVYFHDVGWWLDEGLAYVYELSLV